MTAQDVLEKVARSLVAAGLYKDVATAIRALALEQVQAFERKYCHSLEEYSRLIEGRASMEEEEEWMEWKGATVMLEAWQRALQEVLKSAS